MLNQDQKRVFENVKVHFLHQKCHEAKQCSCDFSPLRLFVSGVGGTGKSFLIEAIKALVNSLWNSEGLLCGIAAPTGLAAFHVGGITIHRLFQLPVEHATKATSYWPLPKASQKITRATLSEVKFFKETVSVLKQRVIQVSVLDKFSELRQSGKAPVCLFPKRKDLNAQMLRKNASEVHDIYCTDEIDETAGNI